MHPERGTRPHRVRRRTPIRPAALSLAAALIMSGCAGSVGRYRNAALAPGARDAQVAPTVPSGGAPDQAGGTAAPFAVPEHPAPTPAAGPNQGAAPAAQTPTPREAAPNARAATGAAPAGRSTTTGQAGTSNSGPPTAPGTGPGAGGAPPAPGGGATPTVPGTTTGVTRDAITVGLLYSKTGAYTGLLRNSPQVLQAAFDEAGPIFGRRLVLKTYDDGTANASTIQVEEKRAKDEVFAMISPASESNVVLAPLANQHGMPVILGNMDEKVALPLPYAFTLLAFWARQATILPSFITNVLHAGDKRIGIVYENTSTAKDAKEAFKAKAGPAGLHVVFEQPVAQAQSTCANEVSNLQAQRVEVVFLMTGPLGGVCMLRDSGALGYRPIWTGVGESFNENVVASATGGMAQGVRTLSTLTTLETPAGRHFSEVMRSHDPNSGAGDDDIMLLIYSLSQTFIEAIRRTGPQLTREAFVQTMETKMSGYDSGYLPPPTFGPGNRSGPLSVGVTTCCTNGRWTTPRIGWQPTF